MKKLFYRANIYLWSTLFTTPFFPKSLFVLHKYINLLLHEKCHFVICHFSNDFEVSKKEEVYNILIINNLYINIYFFCFHFLEKWQMTNDILPIATFNTLILNNLRTQKCHFFLSFCPEMSFFDCNQKCTDRAISGFNR